MSYDGVGRAIGQIQNYIAGGATSAITNVTTLHAFNALGWTTITTDAVGAATHQGFDALGYIMAAFAAR